jgi:hypothetical protein
LVSFFYAGLFLVIRLLVATLARHRKRLLQVDSANCGNTLAWGRKRPQRF